MRTSIFISTIFIYDALGGPALSDKGAAVGALALIIFLAMDIAELYVKFE